MTKILIIISLYFLMPVGFIGSVGGGYTIEHEIVVDHPGFQPEDPRDYVISEVFDSNDLPIHYYVDVASTICLEGVCKIVPVRIHWNPLGEYLKYELDQGITLEKTEGLPFLDEDYQILHEVLRDESSPYKDIRYHQITKDKVQAGDEQVDGFSGATSVILEKGKTVVGAAWTCFTLWHWAHGEMVDVIREIYGANLTLEDIRGQLRSADKKLQRIALEELGRREEAIYQLREDLIPLLTSQNDELINLLLESIEESKTSPLQLVKSDIETLSKEVRIKILQHINTPDGDLTLEELEWVVDVAVNAHNLQEVDLCLDVLANSIKIDTILLNPLLDLLDEEVVVSRRAYYFLLDFEWADSEEERIKEYYLANKDYLY